ncbi:hypothetical protein GE115_04295 [Agromyces sp. CFH 90414]|uniref:DUF559 domain-containing protein n=1 Tax=Agromyces agglutinans TaxID=2662258 RepID=A0A6I2F4C8_9MICO|nr:hypothetical protein [Agromyces agglutinans]MRG59091.1 hypothetical protein [Agromyces agglutinans]
MTRRAPLPFELAFRPFTVRQATEAGVSRSRLRANDLERPFRGVRSPVLAQDAVDRCRAYATRMPSAHAFSHVTAAELFGLPLPSMRESPLHVSALSGREPRMRGIVGHRLDASRIEIRSRQGVRTVSAADAWCQLASMRGPAFSHDDLVAAGDRLLGWPRPLIRVEELDAAIDRHRGSRGTLARDRARRDIRPGSASRRESLLRLDVIRRGFPEPECNGPIDLPTGRVYGDLVFRREKVLMEYEGDHHRTDTLQFARDLERLSALASAGWIVIRVGARSNRERAFGDLALALASRSELA